MKSLFSDGSSREKLSRIFKIQGQRKNDDFVQFEKEFRLKTGFSSFDFSFLDELELF